MDKSLNILTDLEINISFSELSSKLKTSNNSKDIIKTAEKTLDKIHGKWKPSAIFQWFDFEFKENERHGRIIHQTKDALDLKLGCAASFLKPAKKVMVSVYTIGDILDQEASSTSSNGNFLEAYIIDLIGLIALEKTADIIKKKVENQAGECGWGVSPFLSPGSVHGWEIEEQLKLCRLIPIEKIGVSITDHSVLIPFKSIAALIGIGPDYPSQTVGSTCDVCSKKENCPMRS